MFSRGEKWHHSTSWVGSFVAGLLPEMPGKASGRLQVSFSLLGKGGLGGVMPKNALEGLVGGFTNPG